MFKYIAIIGLGLFARNEYYTRLDLQKERARLQFKLSRLFAQIKDADKVTNEHKVDMEDILALLKANNHMDLISEIREILNINNKEVI